MENLIIAVMSEADIESVVAIERASFLNPWDTLSFLSELSCDHAHSFIFRTGGSSKNYQVIAYLCFRVIIDEIHILKIAVTPPNRRRGVAYNFLKKCLNSFLKNEIKAAFLEVRQSNIAGLKLYEKLGFQVIGKRPAYYIDTREDAILMQKNY